MMNLEPYQITKEKVPTPEEVERLLGTCKRLARLDLAHGRKTWVVRYMLVHLACASGLRAGEIAGLRLGDFLARPAGHQLVVEQSRGRGARQVNLGPKLARHIKDYLRIRELTWGEPMDPGDLLLPGRGGRPYSTAALCFSFHRAVEAAGLEAAYSLRNARHAYSAYLLAKTDDLLYVQKQLGHANQSMTVLYRDVTPLLNYDLAQELIG